MLPLVVLLVPGLDRRGGRNSSLRLVQHPPTDHDLILSCLTDDVVWELPGHATLTGKAAFDKEIETDATVGSTRLTIDHLVEEDDPVVAVGGGQVARRDGDRLNFVFCDVFTFTGEKVSRPESYQVDLS